MLAGSSGAGVDTTTPEGTSMGVRRKYAYVPWPSTGPTDIANSVSASCGIVITTSAACAAIGKIAAATARAKISASQDLRSIASLPLQKQPIDFTNEIEDDFNISCFPPNVNRLSNIDP